MEEPKREWITMEALEEEFTKEIVDAEYPDFLVAQATEHLTLVDFKIHLERRRDLEAEAKAVVKRLVPKRNIAAEFDRWVESDTDSASIQWSEMIDALGEDSSIADRHSWFAENVLEAA